MRKLALALFFFAFIIPGAFALDFYNFTDGDHYVLDDDTDITNYKTAYTMRVQNHNGSWFVSFSRPTYSTDDYGFMGKFDTSFLQQGNWKDLQNIDGQIGNYDSTFDFQAGYPTEDLIFVKHVHPFGSANRYDAFSYYDLDLNFINVTEGYDWGDFNLDNFMSLVSHIDDPQQFQTDPTRFVHITYEGTDMDDLQQSYDASVDSGSNKAYFPSPDIFTYDSMDLDWNPRNLLGGFEEYVLTYKDSAKTSIYAEFYEENDFSSVGSRMYDGRQELVDISASGDEIKDYTLIHTARTDPDEWLLAYITDDFPSVVKLQTMILEVNENFLAPDNLRFTVINEYEADLPNVDVTTPSNKFDVSIYNDKLYIFYLIHNGGNLDSLEVLVENLGCSSSAWVDTGECVDRKMKQTRTVVPDGCGETSRFVQSDYCELIADQEAGIYTQQNETWMGTDSCLTDWLPLDRIATCELTKDIPLGCEDVNVTVSALPDFDAWSDLCDEGEYTIQACTPTYDCVVESFPCNQFNGTVSKTTSDFIGGQTANGKVVMTVQNTCKCPVVDWLNLGTLGIRQYQVNGVLEVECSKPYVNEWFCKDTRYKAYRQVDGSVTNITDCGDAGCENGYCADEEGAVDEDGVAIEEDGAFNTFINFFRSPTTLQKLITALVGMTIFGITIMSLAGAGGMKSDKLGLPFMIGVACGFIFFTVIGYISWVFAIIIIFFVGFAFWFMNR